jgi:hypothetical protein
MPPQKKRQHTEEATSFPRKFSKNFYMKNKALASSFLKISTQFGGVKFFSRGA